MPLSKLEASGFAVNYHVNLKCLQLSSSFFVLASLMTSCGYPLRSQPFLNGEWATTLNAGTGGNTQEIPLQITLEVEKQAATTYSFVGTMDIGSQRYVVEGQENADMQLEYLEPQAHLTGAPIEGRVEADDGSQSYILTGYTVYGWGGSPLGPTPEKPTAQLYLHSGDTIYGTFELTQP